MDIVEESNKTLRRLERNDPKLTTLAIFNRDHSTARIKGCFWLHEGADLSRLGNAIANNTNLKRITFHKSSEWEYQSLAEKKAFFDGLKRNTTIEHLRLNGGIGNGIFNDIVANNSNLTEISIHRGVVRGGGVTGSLASAVKKCSNLNNLRFINCGMDDASLKDIALGVRGLSCLQKLYLWKSSSSSNVSDIGIGSAESIVSLLQDPSCNISRLDLDNTKFNNECIQIIVNSLIGNTKLRRLSLSGNNMASSGFDSLVTLLEDPTCNLTELHLGCCSINNECLLKIVTSLMGNTKLEKLSLSGNKLGRSGCESIATLLKTFNSTSLNKIDLYCTAMDDDCATLLAQALIGNNKLKYLDISGNPGITESGWNAFSAILSNCSNHTLLDFGDEDDIENMPVKLLSLLKLNRAVDMEPLFELDEEDDERKPKALPCVVDWFDRRVRDENEEVVQSINARKLSAIFQFARAMPLSSGLSKSDGSLAKKRKHGV